MCTIHSLGKLAAVAPGVVQSESMEDVDKRLDGLAKSGAPGPSVHDDHVQRICQHQGSLTPRARKCGDIMGYMYEQVQLSADLMGAHSRLFVIAHAIKCEQHAGQIVTGWNGSLVSHRSWSRRRAGDMRRSSRRMCAS